jgi:hypothetical protein
MPSSSNSQPADDQCEHCHSTYSLIKRKKTCAVCRQSFCTNCDPREPNHSCRICLTCQLISNNSITDDQLLELKVKQLRLYLQAKDISYDTCTEKRELVDLIKQNRHLPFTRLFNQHMQSTTTTTTTTQTPPQSKSGTFINLQNTVSSFANQMNHIASKIQDYVTNTVSDVINTTLGDQPTTTTNNNNPTGGPFNYSFSSPGNSANRATNNPQQQRRPPQSQAASASPSTSTTNQKIHRKSLSEINNEENIEDLNIRELKEILAANFVDFKGCVEKSELIDKVRRLYRDRQNEKIKAKELGELAASDTELCKICMDAIADCVFLDCGHMVTCVKCGKLLTECPICRLNIVRVVRVFKS